MRIFSFLLLALAFAACKKDTPKPAGGAQPPFVLASSPGSYWVYEWVQVDSSGTVMTLTFRDSVYVSGDTVINGNMYTIHTGSYLGFPTNLVMRDSSGYIIRPDGEIILSTNNFTDTVNYRVTGAANLETYWITKNPGMTVTVAPGTYPVFDHQGHHYNMDGTPFSVCGFNWIQHRYYSRYTGVEIAGQTAYIQQYRATCTYLERRLVKEYIAP